MAPASNSGVASGALALCSSAAISPLAGICAAEATGDVRKKWREGEGRIEARCDGIKSIYHEESTLSSTGRYGERWGPETKVGRASGWVRMVG